MSELAASFRSECAGPGEVSIIAAMSENRVIGRDGRLPWHLPADLRRFKQLTSGHTIVMGSSTLESIGRPLPHRRSIVLSTRPDFEPRGVTLARSLDEALHLSAGQRTFVIGGAAVYRLALPLARCIHLTLVHAQVAGDVTFPPFEGPTWRLVASERHRQQESEVWDFSFLRYDRVT